MNQQEIRDTVFNAVIDAVTVSLDAQLRSLQRLRKEPAEKSRRKRVGMSQVDLVEDILKTAGHSLHISDIIDKIEKTHGIRVDRESIVSSLTKKVAQNDRFARCDKNTFGLIEGSH
jgi:hypothetical protein